MTLSATPPPKLDAPGAGLPLSQRLVLKFWLGPYVSKNTPRQVCRARFEKLSNDIYEEVTRVQRHLLSKPVLVNPIPGLEDSSRYWSLQGVLEHLILVSTSIEQIILLLAAGKVPPGQVDIAKVKPFREGEDFVTEYARVMPGLMARIDEKLAAPGMDFESPVRFKHPWFGGFLLKQWYWLLGSHLAIHRKQAREIIRGLDPSAGKQT